MKTGASEPLKKCKMQTAAGYNPFDGLSSYPGGSSNAPSCFTLQKSDLSTDCEETRLLYFQKAFITREPNLTRPC